MLFRYTLCSVRALISAASVESFTGKGKSVTSITTRRFSTNPTVGEVIRQWSDRFKKEDVPEPVESIEHIVAHVLGTTKILDLVNKRNEPLTSNQFSKLETLCECRLARMPVQYIIGEWDFREINLQLFPPVFIPRPETELLVDYTLKAFHSYESKEPEVLEVGSGSGAISLAIANNNRAASLVAIDTNLDACELTKLNRDRLGLKKEVAIMHATLQEDGTISLSDVICGPKDFDFSSKTFDFIVSNPPYIPTKDIPKLASEIRIYEDIAALDGGEDGLKVIKPLLKYAATALKPGGRLLLEVDTTHPEYIQFFTKKYPILKLSYEHTYKDFCNNDRFVEILKLP